MNAYDIIVSFLASIPLSGWILAILAVGIVYLLFLLFFTPSSEYVSNRLKEMEVFSSGSEREKQMQRSLTDRIVIMTREYIKQQLNKNNKNSNLSALQIKIVQSGLDTDPLMHLTHKFLYALGFGVLGLIANFTPLSDKLPMIPIFIGLAVLGFFVPDIRMNDAIKKRQLQLLRDLPDFLDLLASTQPASNNFEDALSRVCQKLSNEITKEFQTALDEINTGARTRKALDDLALRCNIEEMNRFVSSINHAQASGVGLEKTLKQQAYGMRKTKRQLAEIKAEKSKVLLVLPTIFLLVVCIILIAGPSILAMIDPASAM